MFECHHTVLLFLVIDPGALCQAVSLIDLDHHYNELPILRVVPHRLALRINGDDSSAFFVLQHLALQLHRCVLVHSLLVIQLLFGIVWQERNRIRTVSKT
jgi:hypothetical protein